MDEPDELVERSRQISEIIAEIKQLLVDRGFETIRVERVTHYLDAATIVAHFK